MMEAPRLLLGGLRLPYLLLSIRSRYSQSNVIQAGHRSRAGGLGLPRSTITATNYRLCFLLVRRSYSLVNGSCIDVSLTRSLGCYSSQCGGQGYTGGTCCPTGWSCQTQNAYYAQCLSGTVSIALFMPNLEFTDLPQANQHGWVGILNGSGVDVLGTDY